MSVMRLPESKIQHIEGVIGHTFSNSNILIQALTHPSTKKNSGTNKDYERLEFLGDSVLSLLISETLFVHFANEEEGSLAKRRAMTVSKETLSDCAGKLGFGEFIILGSGEEQTGGRTNKANLENVFEAIVGALYIDGGLEAARGFIEKNLAPYIFDHKDAPKDPKSKLQEWAQKNGHPLPKYEVVSITGPAHQPEITISLLVADMSTRKTSYSKKDAERLAAEEIVNKLEIQ